LRERLRDVEVALQDAAVPDPTLISPLHAPGSHPEPLQTTGADSARILFEAMATLRNAALMLGPVIVTRVEAERGARLAVRVRQDSMPPETVALGGTPDPSSLFLSLQKVQTEVARDLLTSAAASRAGNTTV
jgi:hypothetical protein